MIVSAAQVLNFAEKEVFMWNNLKASFLMLIIALPGLFFLPQFGVFWLGIIAPFVVLFTEAYIYARVGNYAWASIVVNRKKMTEFNVDVMSVKHVEEKPRKEW